MAHAQKPEFLFLRNGRVHLNRRRRQFIRLLEADLCASAVVMLDTTCSEVVWRLLSTHSIRKFPLHFPSRVSPCPIKFQLDSTTAIKKNRKKVQILRFIYIFFPPQFVACIQTFLLKEKINLSEVLHVTIFQDPIFLTFSVRIYALFTGTKESNVFTDLLSGVIQKPLLRW